MDELARRLQTLTAAADFPGLAETLLRRVRLVAGDARFRIAEIELYLAPDPYIHADPRQVATSGKWYFHRQNGKGYRRGTYKGLDLTCGPPGTGGGILIRALVAANGEFVEGPCKVVDRILAETGRPLVELLARALPGGEDAPDALAPGAELRLEYVANEMTGDDVAAVTVAAPRVGLSAKYPEFRRLPLRFLTEVRQTRKDKGAVLCALVSSVGRERAAAIAGKSLRQIDPYVARVDRAAAAPAAASADAATAAPVSAGTPAAPEAPG